MIEAARLPGGAACWLARPEAALAIARPVDEPLSQLGADRMTITHCSQGRGYDTLRFMETLANLPILLCDSPQEWEDWLDQHHTQPHGVWLKFAKKGAVIPTVSYAEALDAALCYGWIDGQKKAYDASFWLQKFTPRRPKSVWSKVNTEKVTQLIVSGKMQPAGLREVEAARRDGRWQVAYQPQSTLTVPDDLRAELERHPEAQAFFDTLNKVNRYAICYRIETAKKPETRRARIEKFIAMLENHDMLHPPSSGVLHTPDRGK